MPEYHYIAFAGPNRQHSHELIDVSPFQWLLDTIAAGYEDGPYVIVHSFPVTEAQYAAHKAKFV